MLSTTTIFSLFLLFSRIEPIVSRPPAAANIKYKYDLPAVQMDQKPKISFHPKSLATRQQLQHPLRNVEEQRRRTPAFTRDDAVAYLRKYGYLSNTPVVGKDGWRDFKRFEVALRKFQRFTSLPETGKLDDITKESMQQPRCGVPDFDGEEVFDKSQSKKKALRLQLKLSKAKRRQMRYKRFAIQGSMHKERIVYELKNFPKNLQKKYVEETLEKAFKVWAEHSPLTFIRKTGRMLSDIEVKFASRYHGDDMPFDGVGMALAHAFYPSGGGDVHFDNDEPWGPQGRNLLWVGAHEIGHSLGLKHTEVKDALMHANYNAYGKSNKELKLHQDDLMAIQSVYGVPDEKENSDESTSSSTKSTTTTAPKGTTKQLKTTGKIKNQPWRRRSKITKISQKSTSTSQITKMRTTKTVTLTTTEKPTTTTTRTTTPETQTPTTKTITTTTSTSSPRTTRRKITRRTTKASTSTTRRLTSPITEKSSSIKPPTPSSAYSTSVEEPRIRTSWKTSTKSTSTRRPTTRTSRKTTTPTTTTTTSTTSKQETKIADGICQDSSIDSIITMPNGTIFAFKGLHFWKFDDQQGRFVNQGLIMNSWAPLRGPIDAMMIDYFEFIWAFERNIAWRMESINNRLDNAEEARKTSEYEFQGLVPPIDAALSLLHPQNSWKDSPTGNPVYFFKGKNYWRDEDHDGFADSFNRNIREIHADLRYKVDAALVIPPNKETGEHEKAFLFSGQNYYQVSEELDEKGMPRGNLKVTDGYPRPIGADWFGC